MSASFGGFDVNSLNDNDLNDIMVDGLGKKTLIGKSDDGFRVLDEAKVLIKGTNKIGDFFNNGKEFGNMDGSKSRTFEMIDCDDDFMLDMVGRVLDGKFGSVDNDKGDGNGSQSGQGINLVVDLNSREETVGDVTSGKGNCIRSAIDEGTDLVNVGGDSESKEGIKEEKDVLMTEGYEEQFDSEKYDDEYHVSDLVWGKVRSHPWWPGQIFSPSAASNKAMEYMKSDSYLIAYFGDGTFAWNEESNIKPFLMNFYEMEKQSNTDEVRYAVSCALDEVSRRVEVGLSCSCLPQEVRDKIETQVVVNAGVRKKYSKRIGGGRFFTAAHTFFPGVIVDFVKFVATHPSREIGTLSVAEKKAELTSFNRWKGRYHLPSLVEFGELEGDEKVERSDYEEVNKVQSKNKKSRVCPSFDESLTCKKKRRISSLMSSTKSNEIAPRSGAISSRSGARKFQKGENIMNISLNVHEIFSKLRFAAINSSQFGAIIGPAADFILECRTSVYGKRSLLLENHRGDKTKQSSSTADEFVIMSSSTGDYKPTALILQFDNFESIPPVTNLNAIFRRFGPLMESETKISSKSMRAQVIFEKQADADAAYSSPGKYSTFGPSLVKYALNHTPSLRKAGGTSKHNKKSHT